MARGLECCCETMRTTVDPHNKLGALLTPVTLVPKGLRAGRLVGLIGLTQAPGFLKGKGGKLQKQTSSSGVSAHLGMHSLTHTYSYTNKLVFLKHYIKWLPTTCFPS